MNANATVTDALTAWTGDHLDQAAERQHARIVEAADLTVFRVSDDLRLDDVTRSAAVIELARIAARLDRLNMIPTKARKAAPAQFASLIPSH